MCLEFRFKFARTFVYWDFEDCPAPDGLEALMLPGNITRALGNMGYRGEMLVKAVGDVLSPVDHEGFMIAGVLPEDVPRRKILAELLSLSLQYRRTPLNVVLILGDISRDMEFLRSLRSVKSRGFYNILLSQPQEASGKVPDCVSTELVWESLAAGDEGLSPKPLDNKPWSGHLKHDESWAATFPELPQFPKQKLKKILQSKKLVNFLPPTPVDDKLNFPGSKDLMGRKKNRD